MLQRQPDAVQTVDHAVATERIDVKAIGFIPGFHFLRFQIHHKANPWIALYQRKQLVDLLIA
ncbi:hypothetical protein D3C76_1842080 [compost metagenome]